MEAGRSQAQGAPQRMNVHGEVMYAKHVTREKVTWENNRKNGALKSGVENASKKRKAGAGRGFIQEGNRTPVAKATHSRYSISTTASCYLASSRSF